MGIVFHSDKPIETSREDTLNRAKFSEALSEAILNYKVVDSLVIGLYGKWGSGKTSVINMSLESLNEIKEEERPIIIKFNPWNFSDQNQLISQLFRQMAKALGEKDLRGSAEKAGSMLEEYSKLFETLGILSSITDGGVGAWIIGQAGKVFKSWGQKKKDLQAQKSGINELLKKLDRKIVVVIDDIDRLNNVEIRQIFQSVKVLGDFPNTIYLLAFDKDVVISALEKVQEGPGLAYLEKIIQIPFEIPQVSQQQIITMLFSNLDEVISGCNIEQWNQDYWGNIFHSGFKDFFVNLRDVHRYNNVLRFTAGLTKEYVNIVDLFAITALQVFEADVYALIRENKELFTGIYASDSYRQNRQEELKKQCDAIISKAKCLSQERMKELLERIFPKLHAYYGNVHYSYSSLSEWRREGRIASPDRFDGYFRLAIPKDEISVSEMNMILARISNEEDFRSIIKQLCNDAKVVRFLELLEDYTSTDLTQEKILIIISVLFDLGDTFPEDNVGFYSFGTNMKIMRITYQLLSRLDSQETRFEILKQAITKADNSLYTIVREVMIQDQHHGRIGSKRSGTEELLISAEQLDELEQIALSKIKLWAESNRLLSHPHLFSALSGWHNWEGKEAVQQYVQEAITDDNNLISFIASSLGKTTSQSGDSYVTRTGWSIDITGIKSVVDIAMIEPRVRNIIASERYPLLNEKEQIALSKFIKALEGEEQDYDGSP